MIRLGVPVAWRYPATTPMWRIGDAGLRVVDVSNPASPLEVGYYDTPG